jgi:hypothetical protein
MLDEEDVFEITESQVTFEGWSQAEFIDDDLRESIKNSAILLVPANGFRSVATPLFPTATEEIFHYLRDNLPADTSVEICINDADLQMLALHSDYKRLGIFLVKRVALQIFIGVFTAYINSKISAPQDTKSQITITNILPPTSTANTTLPSHSKSHAHRPNKYHDPSKVTFTITVEDTSGKSTSFHYEGPVSDVKTVTDQIKKTFLDEPEKTGN